MDDTLLQISKLDFCIQDVTLFLDTHPDDQEAKNYYKEGMKHLLKMKETYLKMVVLLQIETERILKTILMNHFLG